MRNAALAYSEFRDKAKLKFDNKYVYMRYEYYTHKVKVICPIHGLVIQELDAHLEQGCARCAVGYENKAFSRSKFRENCNKNNNGLGILYVIGCWSDDKSEVFIKIGVTSKSIKGRFSGKAAMPYNYKVLHEIIRDADFIYDLEKKLHRKSKAYNYMPFVQFGGSSTECFIADKTYLNNLNTYITKLTTK